VSVLGAILTGAAFGSIHGARHAFEPDHLAAVSTLVAETPGARTGVRLGAMWGLGHTITLIALAVMVGVVGDTLPGTAEGAFELLVAATLLLLGVRAIVRGVVTGPPAHGARASRRWPLLVGMLHGLAGSGALTALAIAEMPSAAGRLAFVAVFGVGSTAGMAVMSGALGAPLARAARHRSLSTTLGVAAGVVAIVVAFLAAVDAIGLIRYGDS